MTVSLRAPKADLFDSVIAEQPRHEALGDGAVLLRSFARDDERVLLGALDAVIAAAPLRHMITPGGFRMSVAMTNCGPAGWVTDRRGYRYSETDPETGRPWPPMPARFRSLAARAATAAGYAGFVPDSCLINRYEGDARLSLHQDRDERDYAAPIVSVSLGVAATFLWGGAERRQRPRRMTLQSGDVVVWGGPTRLNFHGIDRIAAEEHPLTGRRRFNLTFRKAL